MIGYGLDAITTAALLYIVAIGMLVVFGILKVINFAHGALITVGAYAAVITPILGISPWWALVIGPTAAIVVGAFIEGVVLRKLYNRQFDTILATFGSAIVITQTITLVFGRGTQSTEVPSFGTVALFGTSYSVYRLGVLAIVTAIATTLILILHKTRIGLVGQAVIMNEGLAQILGINVVRVRFLAFIIGSGLAGLAGTFLVPMSSIDPHMGLSWLVTAFLLAILVGVSPGALVLACIAFGVVQVFVAASYSSVAASLVLPILAVVLLRFRSGGFANG